MTEAEAEAAFLAWLLDWDASTSNADHADVVAWRGSERIIAEVKGHTGEHGTDINTLYG